MTANNVFDFKNKDKLEILPQHKYETPNISKVNFVLFIVALILLISSLILSVFAIYKVKNMQETVDYLRWDVDQLKSGLLDTGLMDDIRKFENEEVYPDDTEESNTRKWLNNDGDDLDSDYDLNYDDDQNFATVVVDDYNDSSPDHVDIFDLIKGGNLTKIGKELNRSKRDVSAGNVPVNSESYADVKRRNMTEIRRRLHQKTAPISSSENGITSTESRDLNSPIKVVQGLKHYNQLQNENFASTDTPAVLSRRSRVYHAEDKSKAFRRIIRKPRLKSNTQWETIESESTMPEVTVHPDHRRRNRHKVKNNLETFDERPRGRMRLLPAIQFSGDTSKYVFGQHTNYNGNGHLRHLNPTYVDWIANDWVKSINMDQYFQMQDGNLKIKETGLYFVYSQIFYLDEHDTNGYRVYKNKDVILQCTTMTHSVEIVIKGNTCYTAGLEVLNEGDVLSVQDLGTGRCSIFEPGKSFFGLIKMADIKIK